MDPVTLLWWAVHAVVGFGAGWGMGIWRGQHKGYADYVHSILSSKAALGQFLKGEVARRGGLAAAAKGVRPDTLFNSVIDEKFSRMEIMRLSTMVGEYLFYLILVAAALVRGAYLAPLIGIPMCLFTAKQAARERGEPQGVRAVLELFAMFHVWLKEHPIDAFNYAKGQKIPLNNITDLLRESRAYDL